MRTIRLSFCLICVAFTNYTIGASEVIFSYSGTRGVSVWLYQNGQSFGTITLGSEYRGTIPDGNYTFDALIVAEDARLTVGKPSRKSFDVYNGTAYVNIVVSRIGPGRVAITDISIKIVPLPETIQSFDPEDFFITDMVFENTYKDMSVISSGTSFEAVDIRYIAPRITYYHIGSFSGDKVLNIKIIRPDGSLESYPFSPRGYTYSVTLNVRADKFGEQVSLPGLGNARGGAYSVGTYTCEIWSDGQMLHSAKFTVTAAPPPVVVMGTESANTDGNGSTISPAAKPFTLTDADIEGIYEIRKRFYFPEPLLNTVGVSVGSSFATPALIVTVHGSFSPAENMYLDFGLDMGLIYGGPNKSEYYSVDSYYSLYPFINIGYFTQFMYECGWYFGPGAGYMFAKYKFADGTTDVHRFAVSFTTGFNVNKFVDISYTLRTDFAGANHKLSVGYVYRFE